MILNYKDFLNESKNIGLLYHYTTLLNLTKILKSNELYSSNSGSDLDNKIYNKYENYISLTRNKNFHLQANKLTIPIECRITLDGNKLSTKYKTLPYNFNSYTIGDEYEERILTRLGIKNIKNYIIRIDLYEKIKNDEKVFNDYLSTIENLIVNDNIELYIDNIDIEKYREEKELIKLNNINKIYKRGIHKFEEDFKNNNFSERDIEVFNYFYEEWMDGFNYELKDYQLHNKGFSITYSNTFNDNIIYVDVAFRSKYEIYTHSDPRLPLNNHIQRFETELKGQNIDVIIK